MPGPTAALMMAKLRCSLRQLPRECLWLTGATQPESSDRKQGPQDVLESPMLEGLGMSAASGWVRFHHRQGHGQPRRLRSVRAIISETAGGRRKGSASRNFGSGKYVQFSYLDHGVNTACCPGDCAPGRAYLPHLRDKGI